MGIEGLVYIYDGELDGGFYYVPYVYKQMLTTLRLKLMLGAQKENRIFSTTVITFLDMNLQSGGILISDNN